MVPMGLDQGVGLMAWSPLHFGLLSGKFRRDARPSETRLNQLDAPGTVDLERLYRIVDVLTAIAQERSVSAAQVALNWVMHKPGVDTVILGARNEEQLRDNLAAATWRLTAEEMARLDEVSALPEPYPYWHQHKFGIERNPRVPAVRPEPGSQGTTAAPENGARENAGNRNKFRLPFSVRPLLPFSERRYRAAGLGRLRLRRQHVRRTLRPRQPLVGRVVVLEPLLLRIPEQLPLRLHRHVMEQAGGAGAVRDLDRRDRLRGAT